MTKEASITKVTSGLIATKRAVGRLKSPLVAISRDIYKGALGRPVEILSGLANWFRPVLVRFRGADFGTKPDGIRFGPVWPGLNFRAAESEPTGKQQGKKISASHGGKAVRSWCDIGGESRGALGCSDDDETYTTNNGTNEAACSGVGASWVRVGGAYVVRVWLAWRRKMGVREFFCNLQEGVPR
jgi:hypothetical protein